MDAERLTHLVARRVLPSSTSSSVLLDGLDSRTTARPQRSGAKREENRHRLFDRIAQRSRAQNGIRAMLSRDVVVVPRICSPIRIDPNQAQIDPYSRRRAPNPALTCRARSCR